MNRTLPVLLLVGAAALIVGLGTLTDAFGLRSQPAESSEDWSSANGDLSSTRAAAGPARRGVARRLRARWRFRLRGKVGFSGVYASTPVVSGGRVYIQDLNSNVYALALANGRLLWTHRYDRPDGGPNGVAAADGLDAREHRHDGVRPRRADRA